MGIDIHALKFLKFSKKKKLFKNTITLGKQSIYIIDPILRKKLNIKLVENEINCENLLKEYFGSNFVDSIDMSNYENSTYQHDMNTPLPENLKNKYDTIIDSGTLEHIFNFPQAIKNCSNFLSKKGQIIHILPANNFCGHGFYQFSPELFFSIYADENGYEDTEVFLADLNDENHWYKVKRPSDGLRVKFISSSKVYILVRTTLKDSSFNHSNIQQSDYIAKWNNDNDNIKHNNKIFLQSKSYLKKISYLYIFLSKLNNNINGLKYNYRLNNKNPGLEKIKIDSLI